ncbi:uncharacterized protein HMPREF1541_08774 [Cyphellophora europaea CBS 101466]|uniref:Uncharacterized protein n=1 Tax=Cyphellophora europaea (strain CBS 101466) TaxID=1220924 RepID=W2RJ55_CYPE1|nr:uncharacterized protein HMPREF1541_08774 [Cyphellophora europaea CBS 101466]ETN36496.1 hypothetical protein HMPREF1541_08774 [Cyphellophora europaea CBS 101466]
MLRNTIFFLWLLATITLADEQACSPSFIRCAPTGASRRGVPIVGPDLARFFDELVYTVQDMSDVPLSSASVSKDRFTTSYFLPDGSYGTAWDGSYYTPAGDMANLISGEYHMHDGTAGNIYDESPADKPDPSDLPIPTPWTSSGIGTAIPASQLGAKDTSVITSSSSAALSSSTTRNLPSALSAGSEGESKTGSVAPSVIITASHSSSSITGVTTTSLSSLSASSTTFSVTSSSTSTASTALDSITIVVSDSEIPHNPTGPASGSSMMTGTPGASATNSSHSSPIIPPITNFATATVVYCMAAKVLAWAIATLMLA